MDCLSHVYQSPHSAGSADLFTIFMVVTELKLQDVFISWHVPSNYRRLLYTHSINGGALGKPGPNSARTRLVSPLARRKIKYSHIYKFCNKANGGRHSGCIPGGEVALAAKNWRVKILASMSRWFLQRTQNKGRIREKVGVLLIRADCVQFSKRKLTPWSFFPSHELPKLCTLKFLIKRLFYPVGCYLWN